MLRRRLSRPERGFTLLELLAVVVIIGILAGVAIPVFMHQKAKANDAVVKSLARNVVTATETALADPDPTGTVSRSAAGDAVISGTTSVPVAMPARTGWDIAGQGGMYCIVAWSSNSSKYTHDSPLVYDSTHPGFNTSDCSTVPGVPADFTTGASVDPTPTDPTSSPSPSPSEEPAARAPDAVDLLISPSTTTIDWTGSTISSSAKAGDKWCLDSRDVNGDWVRQQCTTSTSVTDAEMHQERTYRVYSTSNPAAALPGPTDVAACVPLWVQPATATSNKVSYTPNSATTSVTIQRRLASGGAWTPVTTNASPTANSTVTVTDSALTAGTNYVYELTGGGSARHCATEGNTVAATQTVLAGSDSGYAMAFTMTKVGGTTSLAMACTPAGSVPGAVAKSATVTTSSWSAQGLHETTYACQATPTNGTGTASNVLRLRGTDLVTPKLTNAWSTGSYASYQMDFNWTAVTDESGSWTLTCTPTATNPAGATVITKSLTGHSTNVNILHGVTYDCAVTTTYNYAPTGRASTASVRVVGKDLVAPVISGSVAAPGTVASLTWNSVADEATTSTFALTCAPLAGSPAGATTLTATQTGHSKSFTLIHGVSYDCSVVTTYQQSPSGLNTTTSNTLRLVAPDVVASVLSGSVTGTTASMSWNIVTDEAGNWTLTCAPIAGSPAGSSAMSNTYTGHSTSWTVLHGVSYDCSLVTRYQNVPTGLTMTSNVVRLTGTPLVAPTLSATVSGAVATFTIGRPTDFTSATISCVNVSGGTDVTKTGISGGTQTMTLVVGQKYDCTETAFYNYSPSGANSMASAAIRVAP